MSRNNLGVILSRFLTASSSCGKSLNFTVTKESIRTIRMMARTDSYPSYNATYDHHHVVGVVNGRRYNHSSSSASFESAAESSSTASNSSTVSNIPNTSSSTMKQAAIADLFYNYAQDAKDGKGHLLSLEGCRDLLSSIGERPDDTTLRQMFDKWDLDSSGKLDLYEFLKASEEILQEAPARIILVVGGPGSGKGILCQRLAQECHVVHLSSGDLLREEVLRNTPLGKECAEIMKRGELVSSAVITSLIRKYMKDYPGRRVLLDGFPRSLENAQDFLDLMGTPELALHLDCDDTILMERIMKRGKQIGNSNHGNANGASTNETPSSSSTTTPLRSDDNFETAIRRLRTYHKSHKQTMDWLREHHIPIVNLDCSGTPENVWNQLLAIGRLMRPMASLQEVSIFPANVSPSSPLDSDASRNVNSTKIPNGHEKSKS